MIAHKASHRRSTWRTCGLTKREWRRQAKKPLTVFDIRPAQPGCKPLIETLLEADQLLDMWESAVIADSFRPERAQVPPGIMTQAGIKFVSVDYPFREIPIAPELQARIAAMLAPPKNSGVI